MKKNKKTIINIIMFILIIAITFFIILKDQDITQIFKIIKNTKKQYIIIAILSMLIYISCEAINIGRTLKILKEKSNFFKNIKFALIGFFFSAITPAASGGQPMQIYYMHKEKISVAHSTLSLLINLSCMQIVTISSALIGFAIYHQKLNSTIIGFFVLGIFLNITALVILLISIFSKKMTNGLIELIIKILKTLKIKNIEEKKEKLEKELNKYQGSAKYIKENKMLIIKILLTTYIQYIFYYSVSYWIYKSLGLNGSTIIEMILMQAILFATVSGIPSPGAVGVSEGGFISIFDKIFPENLIKGAMILNRGINFYLFVLISLIVSTVNGIIVREKDTQEMLM